MIPRHLYSVTIIARPPPLAPLVHSPGDIVTLCYGSVVDATEGLHRFPVPPAVSCPSSDPLPLVRLALPPSPSAAREDGDGDAPRRHLASALGLGTGVPRVVQLWAPSLVAAAPVLRLHLALSLALWIVPLPVVHACIAALSWGSHGGTAGPPTESRDAHHRVAAASPLLTWLRGGVGSGDPAPMEALRGVVLQGSALLSGGGTARVSGLIGPDGAGLGPGEAVITTEAAAVQRVLLTALQCLQGGV